MHSSFLNLSAYPVAAVTVRQRVDVVVSEVGEHLEAEASAPDRELLAALVERRPGEVKELLSGLELEPCN